MTRPQIEITQEFGFDAAHYLAEAPLGSNRRLHGHSFYAEVTLKGEPDEKKGWVRDFGEVNAALGDIRAKLDHHLLNDIEGLGTPTLENLARYIFREAKARLPEVYRVKLNRPSVGQSCIYQED
jgi:6-pyruvoyltetrahydropterin/6-carboxytetrahydropterin synthase